MDSSYRETEKRRKKKERKKEIKTEGMTTLVLKV
jgi:hypothetical protein